MKEKFIPYHTHLIVKGYIYNPPMNEEKLNEFFIDLVESVNMKVVAGPTSVYVDDVWSEENPSLFHFDLYSCSKFDHKKVLDFIGDRFDMIDYKFWFIDRNDDFQLIDKN